FRGNNFADFVLLCVDQAGGEHGTFFITQFDGIFRFIFRDGLCFFEGFDFLCVEFGDFFGFLCGGEFFSGYFGGFSAACEEPTRERAARTAGARSVARQNRAAVLNVIRNFRMHLVSFLFDRSSGSSCRTIAEFRERFARKKDFVLDGFRRARRSARLAIASAFGAIVVEVTPGTTSIVSSTIIALIVISAIFAVASLRRGIF